MCWIVPRVKRACIWVTVADSRLCVCVCVCGSVLIHISIFINFKQKGGDNIEHISPSSSHLPLSDCHSSFLVLLFPPSPSFDSLSFPETVYTRRLRTYSRARSLYQSWQRAALSLGCLLGPMCLASWFSTYVSHTLGCA